MHSCVCVCVYSVLSYVQICVTPPQSRYRMSHHHRGATLCLLVLQRNRTREREIWGDLTQELVYAILEAKRSPSPLSANWRCRKASGVILSESEGSRTRSTASEGRRQCMFQVKQREQNRLPPIFVLFRSSVDWVRPTLVWVDLLYSGYWFKRWSLSETPSSTPQNVYQWSGHPLAQSSSHITLTSYLETANLVLAPQFCHFENVV